MLFNPTPDSKAHQLAMQRVRGQCLDTDDAFWLHLVIFRTYLPAWRTYISDLEQRFLPTASSVFATFIDEPLRLGYNQLKSLTRVEARFHEAITNLASASDVLEDFARVYERQSGLLAQGDNGKDHLENLRRQCQICSRNSSHLQKRVKSISRLLANTVLFRDQLLAKEQSKNMTQLNRSAFFMTTLTLFYLPGSFLAVSISIFY